jgi:hypothetical protein
LGSQRRQEQIGRFDERNLAVFSRNDPVTRGRFV